MNYLTIHDFSPEILATTLNLSQEINQLVRSSSFLKMLSKKYPHVKENMVLATILKLLISEHVTQVTLLISEPDNILMGIEIFDSGTNTSKCFGNKYKFTRSWQVEIILKIV